MCLGLQNEDPEEFPMKPTDPQREAQENHAAASSLVTEGDEAGTTIVEIHTRANSQRQPSGRSVRFSQDFASGER